MKYYNDIPDKTPFIHMLYIQDGEQKTFSCDWANECIEEFSNIEVEIFVIYVMGQRVTIRNKEELLKFCNG